MQRWKGADLALLILVAIIYFLAMRVSLLFPDAAEVMSAIWPVGGIALSVLLLTPREKWLSMLVVIGVANLLGNISVGKSIPLSAGYLVANLMEPALTAWLMTRFLKHEVMFSRAKEVLVLIGTATLVTGGTAFIGAASAYLAEGVAFWPAYISWWVADGIGMILVAPFVVTMVHNLPEMMRKLRWRQWTELLVFAVAWCTVVWLIFALPVADVFDGVRPYMVLPFLIWSALRFRPCVTATASLVMAGVAVMHSDISVGSLILAGDHSAHHLESIQAFVVAISMSVLLLSISVSERRDTNRQLQQAKRKAESADTAKRLAIDAARAGTLFLDLKQDYLEWDQHSRDIFGLDSESFKNHYDDWLNCIHREDTENVESEVNRQILSGKTIDLKYRIIRPDGELRYIWAVANIIRDETNQAIALSGLHFDITESTLERNELQQHRDHLEQLVEERTAMLSVAKQAAEAASVAKSLFLSNVSHELRTPLNGIMGMTDLALLCATDPKQVGYLTRSREASQHLLRLIEDILEMSMLDVSGAPFRTTDFLLSSVLFDVATATLPVAQTKNLQIVTDYKDGPLWLRGDPLRLRQALLNYAINAVKFTEKGTVTLHARIAQDCGDEVQVRFEVTDTGVGIAPEATSRIFTVFEQADNSPSRKYTGTGLGLAITRRLVTLMGGEVGADSTPGEGSTFWFTVRLQRGSEGAPKPVS